MNPVVRSALGALLGIVCGLVVIFPLEFICHLIFPLPSGIDINDPVAVKAAIASVPTAAIALALLSELVGTFAGAWVAARFARHAPLVPGMIVGGFFLLGAIANMKLIPHPLWCWVIAIPGFPLAGFLASRLVSPAAKPQPAPLS